MEAGRDIDERLRESVPKLVTIEDYQRLAQITKKKDASFLETLDMCALGIAGEGGEIADTVKKVLYHGHDLDREHMIKELGDVLWYVTIMAAEMAIPLRYIMEANIAKLAKRYPEGFSSEASINRKA